jgi:hypothetical protein
MIGSRTTTSAESVNRSDPAAWLFGPCFSKTPSVSFNRAGFMKSGQNPPGKVPNNAMFRPV